MNNIKVRSFFSGICVGLGALLSAIMITESNGLGINKLIASMSFSFGLFLSIAGAGLMFTDICSIIFKRIKECKIKELILELIIVWVFNFIGALLLVILVSPVANNIAQTFVSIGVSKVSIKLIDMYWKGFFCSALICFATLIVKKAKSYVDLFISIAIPVIIFICCDFEYSIANMFYLPMAWLCSAPISFVSIIKSISIVTIGNLSGGFFLSYYAYKLGEFDE